MQVNSCFFSPLFYFFQFSNLRRERKQKLEITSFEGYCRFWQLKNTKYSTFLSVWIYTKSNNVTTLSNSNPTFRS